MKSVSIKVNQVTDHCALKDEKIKDSILIISTLFFPLNMPKVIGVLLCKIGTISTVGLTVTPRGNFDPIRPPEFNGFRIHYLYLVI